MRDPQFYASALKRCAERVQAAADEAEDHGATPYSDKLYPLAEKLSALSERWQELSFEAGRLKLETYQLLGEDIDVWPWTKAVAPEVEPLYKNMLENDVT